MRKSLKKCEKMSKGVKKCEKEWFFGKIGLFRFLTPTAFTSLSTLFGSPTSKL